MSDWMRGELAEIEARAKAATGGTWVEDGDGDIIARFDQSGGLRVADFVPWPKDRTFIASARADVPRLVAALRLALREIGEDYEDASGELLLPKIELALKGVDNA